MKVARALIWVAAAASVAGCLSNPEPNSRYPRVEAVTPGIVGSGEPLREYQVNLVVLLRDALCDERPQPTACRSDSDRPAADEDYEGYARLQAIADEVRSEQARNTVVGQLVAASVHNCHVYMQSLRGGQVGVRTAADMMSTTFGLAGGLIEPLSTARALSALGAWSTASGATWDRNVYAEQAAEMIAEEIRKLRVTERATLEAKYTRSYDQWPLATALTDVADFHNSCSMLRGISLIQDAVANRERSVRAARQAAMAALNAGGDGVAVAAAVAGVESIFLGYGADSISASPLEGFALGGDLNALITRGRNCADALKRAADPLPEACTATDGWENQFVALAMSHQDLAAATDKDPFEHAFHESVQTRRRAIEAGRALYVEHLRRATTLGWSKEQILSALRALAGPKAGASPQVGETDAEGEASAPEPASLANDQGLMLADPVLDMLTDSFEALSATGDRGLVVRSTLALAQAMTRAQPSATRAEVERQAQANTADPVPAGGTGETGETEGETEGLTSPDQT